MSAHPPLLLALDGGTPAITEPLPPMYPGGMRIGDEEEQAVLEVLRSRRLFRYYGPNPGPSQAEQLEQEFAAQMGSSYAIAVSSGTASLVCGLIGLGVGPGDEVIVPSYTWIASASAVLSIGAIPVVAEVDASLTLDPTQLEQRMSPRTRAIIVVHMRGAPSDMDAIMAIAQRHGIGVLEDVAQACGASYRGRRLGSIGDVGAFSFQFNKIMTAGEGGMVITSNPEIHQRVQMYQDVYGGRRNGIPADQILPGVNYRMGELPAAVALAQLHRLDQLLQDMRANRTAILAAVTPTLNAHNVAVRSLNDPSGDASIALVMLAPTAEQATWMAKALRAEGAGGFVLYRPDQVDYHVYTHWEPIVHQRSWSEPHNPWSWHGGPFDYSPQACPRSLDLLGRAVHLDISPDLSGTQIEEIAEAIVKVVQALPTA